jgi:hypothetical protein
VACGLAGPGRAARDATFEIPHALWPFLLAAARRTLLRKHEAPMHPPDHSQPLLQLFWLIVLAVPVACVAWTVTHEEIFREPRDYCARRSQDCRGLLPRKFFYLFTCEYCFSHYVTLFFLFLTGFKLLLDDWRGYLIGFFGLVFVANVYMNFYSRLRVEIHVGKTEAKKKEKELEIQAAVGDGRR